LVLYRSWYPSGPPDRSPPIQWGCSGCRGRKMVPAGNCRSRHRSVRHRSRRSPRESRQRAASRT
jgi:hypothetical protein